MHGHQIKPKRIKQLSSYVKTPSHIPKNLGHVTISFLPKHITLSHYITQPNILLQDYEKTHISSTLNTS